MVAYHSVIRNIFLSIVNKSKPLYFWSRLFISLINNCILYDYYVKIVTLTGKENINLY